MLLFYASRNDAKNFLSWGNFQKTFAQHELESDDPATYRFGYMPKR